MSRVCPITGKGPLSGNNRSHSLRATRRVQNPNLQKFQININGKMTTVRMSARGYRTLMKTLSKQGNAKNPNAVKPHVVETTPVAPAVEEVKEVETKVEEEKAAEPEVVEEETKDAEANEEEAADEVKE